MEAKKNSGRKDKLKQNRKTRTEAKINLNRSKERNLNKCNAKRIQQGKTRIFSTSTTMERKKAKKNIFEKIK